MIKASVLYPNGDATTFDYDYFVHQHIPMVQELLGDKLRGISVDRGIAGGAPGAPPPYLAMVHLVFDSMEDFRTAAVPIPERLSEDVPNYTNVVATMQISEVVSSELLDRPAGAPTTARG